MDRVCDDTSSSVTSVAACHEACAGYRYMGFACPQAGSFECWCCNELDANSNAEEALIPESECAGGEQTSGISGNHNDHCSGFDGADWDGYNLGGAMHVVFQSSTPMLVQKYTNTECVNN